MAIKAVTRTQGYHNDVSDYICNNSDADKPVIGGAATGKSNGTTCLNVEEKIEYIVYEEIWYEYVTLN